MGDSIGEVYFQLGEASLVEGTTHWWGPGKGGDLGIIAQIEDGKLTDLNCEYKNPPKSAF